MADLAPADTVEEVSNLVFSIRSVVEDLPQHDTCSDGHG
jgi:hypothetical protein